MWVCLRLFCNTSCDALVHGTSRVHQLPNAAGHGSALVKSTLLLATFSDDEPRQIPMSSIDRGGCFSEVKSCFYAHTGITSESLVDTPLSHSYFSLTYCPYSASIHNHNIVYCPTLGGQYGKG
ncbi:hypothetical protein CEXT_347861 [Caerostris extrusa]|uniref:Secreted protein n=1 Tax=Caerostris extrusa TaxID=172846 RepID=A0AAV4WHU2_CAEEX|nr:hypothetical protein CEXT_347861 [Caerostris extrusa]